MSFNNKEFATMRKTLIALAAVAAALAPHFAAAQQDSGQWLLRARALYLQSDNSDSTGLDLKINDKAFPEFDVSYFFTPNIATELVLTYPQRQTIRSGDTIIGSLKHLPPTLTLQYHFTDLKALRPYVGAGVNYTRFSSVSFEPAVDAALSPSIKKNSFGWALQAGVDVPVKDGWLVNFDLKKVQIETDVSSAGTKVGTFKVNPLLVSVGVGKRF